VWVSDTVTTLQSTTPGLHPVSVRQMSPLQPKQRTPDYCLLLIYRPRKDERLSWPSCLACSRWFTHISGHPSAAGQAQDSESQHSTTGPRNQSTHATNQLTLLNPTNPNCNSKTIKTHCFLMNKSTTPLQRLHLSEYAVHPEL